MRYEREDVKADLARLGAGSGCGLVQRGDSERGIQPGETIVAGKVAGAAWGGHPAGARGPD